MTTDKADIKAIVDELHLACVVDENGKEIPITREMIEEACISLIETFHIPHRSSLN